MRRAATPIVILLCGLSLGLACFGRAFFRDEQFGYRDAAHFYYPLYQRVQTEWQAGRWPLWEPEENGGMPLLGIDGNCIIAHGGSSPFAIKNALRAACSTIQHKLNPHIVEAVQRSHDSAQNAPQPA